MLHENGVWQYVLFTSGGEYAITASGVSIDTDNKTATVYVPVFTDSKGAALDVYDGSEIFGNATYEIIDTEYGKAMKVTATGNILIFTKHPDGAPSFLDKNSIIWRCAGIFSLKYTIKSPYCKIKDRCKTYPEQVRD